MKRALVIRHSPSETLARNYTTILEEQGFRLDSLNLFKSAPRYDRFSASDLNDIDMIVVLGGPLHANADYPALREERAYMNDALAQSKPIFAVCLGAQLMALELGATVEPTGGYQFGLRKIFVTAEGASDPVFSKIAIPLVPTLHGDCFSHPPGAVGLAEGFILQRDGRYRRINTAFRYGNSYGFQFEPQPTLEELLTWNQQLSDDYKLMGCDFDPEEESARNVPEFTSFAPHHEKQMRELLMAFLGNARLVRMLPDKSIVR